MNGKTHWNRRATPKRIQRKSSSQPVDTVDVGDWTLGQSEDGSLFVHNVMTGHRFILAAIPAKQEEST